MGIETGRRHEHRGRSSSGILDATAVLEVLHLRLGDSLLDAGCGDGHFSLAASCLVGGEGRIYAVDSDETGINILKNEIARRGLVNIKPIVADISDAIPLPDELIDVTLMANVLHGLVANGEADGAMREIGRVMKHGGRSEEHDAKLLVVEFKKDSPVGPPEDIRLSPDQVQDIMAGYGFKDPVVSDAGPYHYAVIMIRTV